MGKLQKIKQAVSTATDNDATKAIKYLLWYIESQNAEIEFLRKTPRASEMSAPYNASNQIEYQRRLADEDKASQQEHDELVARFRKNV